MVTEDYVSFETAKLLKEKGFESDDCHTAYDENGEFFLYGDYSKDRNGVVDAPTRQMAMKWLRKVLNIHIELRVLKPYGSDGHHHSIPKDGVVYYAEILHIDKWDKYLEEFEHVGIPTKDTHEEACEAAIRYCLENLI